MELTGRVTPNVVIKKMNEEEVDNFSIAINEYYKPKKTAAEGKEITRYIACRYSRNTALAKGLVKGAVVEVEGIIYIRVCASKDDEPKAATNFRFRHIKVIGVTANKEMTGVREEGDIPAVENRIENISPVTEPMDDVPFQVGAFELVDNEQALYNIRPCYCQIPSCPQPFVYEIFKDVILRLPANSLSLKREIFSFFCFSLNVYSKGK